MLVLEDEGTMIETSEATTQIHGVTSLNTSTFHTYCTSLHAAVCATLRADRFARQQEVQRSLQFQFAVSWGPRISVQQYCS